MVHEAVRDRPQTGQGAGLRRVSVYADSARVDVALPAAMPIGSLIPAIVDILTTGSGPRDDSLAVRYQLSLPGHAPLDPSKTLAQSAIRDGTTLILTRSSDEPTAPRFDDPADAVSASLATTTRPRTRQVARVSGVLTATCLAVTGAGVLIGTALDNDHSRRCAAVPAGVAFVALLAATATVRVLRERAAGLTLGLVASGFAALSGWLAIPGGPAPPNAVLAMAVAAASAVVMGVMGCGTAVFTAVACFSAAVSGAAMIRAVTAVPVPAIGAASAVLSLGLIEVSARVSIMLAGLSPALEPKPTTSDALSVKAIRANTWLTSLVAAFSACAALGAIGAAAGPHSAGSPQRLGLVFAALTGGVLLLRARSRDDVAKSVPLLVSGTATLSATLVVAAINYPPQAPYIAATAVIMGGAALGLGFLTPVPLSPVGRRSIELLEYVALAALVPLACWICGLYGAARGLSLP